MSKNKDIENVPEIEKMRHTASHILAQAVLKHYPDAKLGIGPAIENGFYYDFLFSSPISEEDLEKIEEEMKEIIKADLPLTQIKLDRKEAIKMYKGMGQEFKLELIEGLEDKQLSFFTTGEDEFKDLCRGPHVASTGKVKAVKLHALSGAYWRGDEKNQMLQRIYGYAFNSPKELRTHIANIEEAEKRDHRKLGKQLDLFHIDESVGLGLPLWHPKGSLIWREIEDFWYKEHMKAGYKLVRSPHIANKHLWETSGHWNFYNETMYSPLEAGQSLEELQKGEKVKSSEQYLLKPMNCPFHVKIYQNDLKSYRQLPLRYAESGTVYRYEKKGVLSGLTRVRGFTQDDAHIICRKDQVEAELGRVVDFIMFIFSAFGFGKEDIKVYLSLRDPEKKEKYAGSDEGWEYTEKVLEDVAKEKKLDYVVDIGEAAFYGAKLDFKLRDALGREWQCSTLQFDFNLPERFDMKYTNSEGQEERPYMLHRALLGSYERFIGLLIEHYNGAFPLWISPVQAIVIPISDDQKDYAQKMMEEMIDGGLRAELDDRSETLQARIRDAELQKIPYIIIVGKKEIDTKTVSVRARGKKEIGLMKIDEFVKSLRKEIDSKGLN